MSESITVTSYQQLNALVAERVMGWTREKLVSRGIHIADDGITLGTLCPQYSNDLNAAEKIANKLGLNITFEEGTKTVWKDEYEAGMLSDYEPLAIHQSTAIAICIAALKLQGIDINLVIPPTSLPLIETSDNFPNSPAIRGRIRGTSEID